MNFSYPQVVFQEVPNHISLAFSISGCSLGCKGCHSTETWDENFGTELTDEVFINWLNKYKGMVSNILFYGGEWEANRLTELLTIAKQHDFKTSLYTGLELPEINKNILANVTYIKTGKFIKSLGGITSEHSNQFFYDMENKLNLTHLFRETNLSKQNNFVGNIETLSL